ncbi:MULTISPECIES: YdcF family protein [Hyphobacterium]|uniref:YdcF family protein n=1 Tax=Hyphobacterium vulgare TaxID=1736751 RepID=A0ABV6ZZ60_9PROT
MAARLGAFLVLGALLAGFVAFSVHIARLSPDTGASGDAIIVLTGGEGRLAVATELLERRAGSRLLISGVHPDVTPDELRAAMGASAPLFDCCVDLGREAADTTGNAIETAGWVSERGYDRVLIVTSDYHLPRSLLEMRARMPEVELVAYPVPSPRPWTDVNSARRWVLEYLKFTAVWARYSVSNPHA